MIQVAPENDLLSAGKVCELLQVTPRKLERAAAKAAVMPALRLNSVDYFTDADVGAIRKQLSGQKS